MFGSVLLWVRVAAQSQAQRLGIALSGSPKENGKGRAEARQVCGVTEQPSQRRQAWAELSYNTRLLWAGLRASEDKAKETGPVCRILGHRVSDDSQLPASTRPGKALPAAVTPGTLLGWCPSHTQGWWEP